MLTCIYVAFLGEVSVKVFGPFLKSGYLFSYCWITLRLYFSVLRGHLILQVRGIYKIYLLFLIVPKNRIHLPS